MHMDNLHDETPNMHQILYPRKLVKAYLTLYESPKLAFQPKDDSVLGLNNLQRQ
jgi:hypothetical protein